MAKWIQIDALSTNKEPAVTSILHAVFCLFRFYPPNTVTGFEFPVKSVVVLVTPHLRNEVMFRV